jgi:hypothetical protein
MSFERCPECGCLFPLDVHNDVRITSYCVSPKDWHRAGADMELCGSNIAYLIDMFVPLTPEERVNDARFRRLCAWLEEYTFV